jgi:hypothetical protein
LDVRISAVATLDESPERPRVGNYYSGPEDFLYVEHEISDMAGVARKHTWLFRKGKALPWAVGAGGANGGANSEYWSMNVSLMQVPITSHPNLKKILDAGGGVLRQGEVEWPRYLNGVKNSWYGISGFLVPGVSVTKETIKSARGVAEKLSFTEVDDVGYSEGRLAGGFYAPGAGAKRKPWVLESHTLSSAGNEFRETKVWRYGGVIGWLDMIYEKGYWRKEKR